MKCPYLQGEYLQSCKVSKEVYVPSRYEFEEYCTKGFHTICPLYADSASNRTYTSGPFRERVYSGAR